MPMRRRPEDVSESLAVFLPAHLDLSGTHRSFEAGMVTLGLVGIGDWKVAQCFIKGIAGAEIAGGPRTARPPWARATAQQQALPTLPACCHEGFDEELNLRIAELADVAALYPWPRPWLALMLAVGGKSGSGLLPLLLSRSTFPALPSTVLGARPPVRETLVTGFG
jgi:hypothetical protein